jgi:hypothetical protein
MVSSKLHLAFEKFLLVGKKKVSEITGRYSRTDSVQKRRATF